MKKKLAAHFSQGRNILTYLLVAGIITALFACPQTPSADDWQLVPYEPCYYVALWGSDSNAGIAESLPFKSLARALEKTKTDPQRKTIYVLSDLNAATENSGSMEAVFLVDGTGGKEITIAARAQAILSGALDSRPTLLVRKGSRLVINNITFSNSAAAGILVRDASVLTLSGAKSITNRGGTGLIIEGGSQCIMEDGAILNNLNTGGPGGVHVRGSSGFTMTGTSLVQGNQGAPGGVLVEDASLFTMKNGASVAGNFAVEDGAGVSVRGQGSRFVMSNTSSLTRNYAPRHGGALFMEDHAEFEMTDSAFITSNQSSYDVLLPDSFNTHLKGIGAGIFMTGYCKASLKGNARISDNVKKDYSEVGGAAVTMENFCELSLGGNAKLQGNQGSYDSSYSQFGAAVYGKNSCSLTMSGNSGILDTKYSYGVLLETGSSMTMKDNSVVSRSQNAVESKGIKLVDCTSFTLRDNAMLLRGDGFMFTNSTGTPARVVMEGDAGITGSYYTAVELDGNVAMEFKGDAYIKDGYAGGGIVLKNGAALTMSGNAAITNNSGGLPPSKGGRGVCVDEGSFTMQGGSISGNRIEINTNVSSGVNDYVYGCGVQVGASGLSTFTMTGGSISGNSIARTNSSGGAMFHAYGAGVAVRSGSSVTGQVGGSIAYNTITNVGGNNTIAGLSVWIEGVGNTDSNLTPGTNWP